MADLPEPTRVEIVSKSADGLVVRIQFQDGAPQRHPLDQILFALDRQARALEHRADELMAQHDYGAEGPGQDAMMLRAAIAVLQGHPWLTELRDYPLPPWKSVSMLRSLPLGTLAVQFARQPTTTEIDHLVTLLRRAGQMAVNGEEG